MIAFNMREMSGSLHDIKIEAGIKLEPIGPDLLKLVTVRDSNLVAKPNMSMPIGQAPMPDPALMMKNHPLLLPSILANPFLRQKIVPEVQEPSFKHSESMTSTSAIKTEDTGNPLKGRGFQSFQRRLNSNTTQ